MGIGPASTTEQAIESLAFLRSHKPFKYGGDWYVFAANGQGYAFRNRRDVAKKLAAVSLHEQIPVSLVSWK